MRLLAIVAVLVAAPRPAMAFHEISSFTRTANTGGGAGYWFTGSPRFKGYDCTICHTNAPNQISIELSSQPPGLGDGEYELGLEYSVTVTMLGETKGLESAFNPNTFVMEILADSGEHVGAYAVDVINTPMRIADDARVPIAEGFGEGESEWTFTWTAPDADPGPATLFLGALDGDGASDPDRRWIDAINDDVAVVELRLCTSGTECPELESQEEEQSAVACSAAEGSRELILWLAIALAIVLSRRRRPTSS